MVIGYLTYCRKTTVQKFSLQEMYTFSNTKVWHWLENSILQYYCFAVFLNKPQTFEQGYILKCALPDQIFFGFIVYTLHNLLWETHSGYLVLWNCKLICKSCWLSNCRSHVINKIHRAPFHNIALIINIKCKKS